MKIIILLPFTICNFVLAQAEMTWLDNNDEQRLSPIMHFSGQYGTTILMPVPSLQCKTLFLTELVPYAFFWCSLRLTVGYLQVCGSFCVKCLQYGNIKSSWTNSIKFTITVFIRFSFPCASFSFLAMNAWTPILVTSWFRCLFSPFLYKDTVTLIFSSLLLKAKKLSMESKVW